MLSASSAVAPVDTARITQELSDFRPVFADPDAAIGTQSSRVTRAKRTGKTGGNLIAAVATDEYDCFPDIAPDVRSWQTVQRPDIRSELQLRCVCSGVSCHHAGSTL